MRHRLLVLTLAALAAGCSQRERSNPLDPANPHTGGRPAGFNAIAGYAVVTLTWTPQPALGIDGFRLERQLPGDMEFRPIATLLSAGTGRYLDSGLRNGELARYRLYYVTGGQRLDLAAEDVATPGAVRAWVVDPGLGALVRLSPDGRDIALEVRGAGSVQSLAVSGRTGDVWTSSRQDGTLTLREAGGLQLARQEGLGAPYTLAYDARDESVWVCELDGSVAHFASDGEATSPRIAPLDRPLGVAVSGLDGTIWICETGANRLRHFSRTGTPLSSVDLVAPRRVAVDSASGVAWVSSYDQGRLWRIAADGTLIDSTRAAVGPLGLAIDTHRNIVWIADAYAGRVLALDRSTMAVVHTVGGLSDAEDVALDPTSGDAWVLVRGQAQVVRLSRDGVLLERCGGFINPYEIRLDPGVP